MVRCTSKWRRRPSFTPAGARKEKGKQYFTMTRTPAAGLCSRICTDYSQFIVCSLPPPEMVVPRPSLEKLAIGDSAGVRSSLVAELIDRGLEI